MRPSRYIALWEYTGPLLLEQTMLTTTAIATPLAMAANIAC